ncbi:hypothetical protein CL176_04830 [Suicoccus acidiformans]|uniref:Solute-binding protein family 3/N-terminal domain-containing protein n=1 Tax=Suicoccus acidiformans TaxID=2036206 RepID=A0A347WJX2_9LACT|nr:transporter substrate-binding domain-containing protein [Suicoccus acidiformans]AXY25379.1 hypothetical protein CL176_04830 [Suicoccus acidiformans]
MKKWLKKVFVGLSLSLLALAPVQAEAISVEEIQDKGEVVLATSADFPPYEWVKMIDGKEQIIGSDIELAQAIADKLGVELKIVNTSFDSLITQVTTGKVDMVIAGMNHTEERAKQADFSDVYYLGVNQFIATKEVAEQVKAVEDLADMRLGVQQTSLQEQVLLGELPDATIKLIPDNGDLVQSLLTNRLDAVLFDSVVAEQFARQNADRLQVIEDVAIEYEEGAGMSVLVPKDSPEFIALINEVIAELAAEDQYNQWIEEYIQQID